MTSLSRHPRNWISNLFDEKLYLTEGTVKNYMSNILSKLGLRNRMQAVLKAKELRLV